MIKPMTQLQIDQLSREYWEWFSETSQYGNQKIPELINLKQIILNNSDIELLYQKISTFWGFGDIEDLSPLEKTINHLKTKTHSKVKNAITNNLGVKGVVDSLYGQKKQVKYKNKLKINYPFDPKLKKVYKELASYWNFGDIENLSPLEKTIKRLLVLEHDSKNKLDVMKELKDHIGEVEKDLISGKLVDKYKSIRETKYNRIRGTAFIRTNLFKYFRTCPYCNYIYLSNLEQKSNGKDYYALELDHYFPKDKYPYLALTIFNLVPSCHVCNGIKNNKGDHHLYPYEDDSIKEMKFRFDTAFFTELNDTYINLMDKKTLLYDKDKIKVKIDIIAPSTDIGKRAEASKQLFQLENKYSDLKDEMKDLYFKYLSSNICQVNELLNFSELRLSKNEIKEIYYGVKISSKEYHKRPLSKFITDLIKDLEREY